MASDPKRQPAERDTAAGDAYTEFPEADAAEQQAALTQEDDWLSRAELGADRTVSEGDAVEQLREIELDEDEYR